MGSSIDAVMISQPSARVGTFEPDKCIWNTHYGGGALHDTSAASHRYERAEADLELEKLEEADRKKAQQVGGSLLSILDAEDVTLPVFTSGACLRCMTVLMHLAVLAQSKVLLEAAPCLCILQGKEFLSDL